MSIPIDLDRDLMLAVDAVELARWTADRWMLSERSIDRMIASGVLKAYRIGKRSVRLDANEVEAALKAHSVPVVDA